MSHRKLLPSARPVAGALVLCTLSLAAGSALATEYGTVVSSTPIDVQVPVPQTACTDQPVAVRPATSGGGALLGALIGGAIGHNLGGGIGRAVATSVGAVTGAAVGDRVEANATPLAETTVRQCNTVTGYQTRTIGYDVVYDYNGQRYSARVAQAPGARIALDVAVSPAGAAAPAQTDVVAAADPAPVVYAPATYAVPAYPAYPAYYGPQIAVVPRLFIGGYWGRGRWR